MPRVLFVRLDVRASARKVDALEADVHSRGGHVADKAGQGMRSQPPGGRRRRGHQVAVKTVERGHVGRRRHEGGEVRARHINKMSELRTRSRDRLSTGRGPRSRSQSYFLRRYICLFCYSFKPLQPTHERS